MKDFHHNFEPVVLLVPTTIDSATTTTATAYVTLDDAEGLEFLLLGAVTDGEYEPLVEWAEEDVNGDPDTWEAVPDEYLLGTEAGATLDDDGVAKIGYRGHKTGKKFLRCSVVSTNTTSGAIVGVVALKTELRHNPHTAQTVAA